VVPVPNLYHWDKHDLYQWEKADWDRLCLSHWNRLCLSQGDRHATCTKPVPVGLGKVKSDLSLSHGQVIYPWHAGDLSLSQDRPYFHDGTCPSPTCPNLFHKVGLQGRGIVPKPLFLRFPHFWVEAAQPAFLTFGFSQAQRGKGEKEKDFWEKIPYKL